MITNDAVIFGILAGILGLIFWTSNLKSKGWKKFYRLVPSILLCYFIPSLGTSLGLFDPSQSKIYFVASRFLLPASIVLLTLSLDLNEVRKLGSKALILFFAGTIGVILGGPISLLVCSAINPDWIGGNPDQVWRAMSTVAGSWIGGGANMMAMKEIFNVDDKMFSAMITVDVLVAQVWMVVVLYIAQRSAAIDARTGADTSAINRLIKKVEEFEKKHSRIPKTHELMAMVAIAFAVVGGSHLFADTVAPWVQKNAPSLEKFSLTSKFFWLIVVATTIGIGLSFTRARKMEGLGASKLGSVLIYFLVAAVGMKMDVMAIFDHPGLFVVGLVWMLFHVVIMFAVAKYIRAPAFFLAVGSKANIGGAVSAPIVASAFHPKLAPVGVLLAVLGYGLGTYGAWLCAQLMRLASGG